MQRKLITRSQSNTVYPYKDNVYDMTRQWNALSLKQTRVPTLENDTPSMYRDSHYKYKNVTRLFLSNQYEFL